MCPPLAQTCTLRISEFEFTVLATFSCPGAKGVGMQIDVGTAFSTAREEGNKENGKESQTPVSGDPAPCVVNPQ